MTYNKQVETIRALETVLKVLENLFFSLPIPEEIVQKYNYLKLNKYKNTTLYFTPINKSQYPTIGTVNDTPELFESQVKLYESILNTIIQQGESLLESTNRRLSLREYAIDINEAKAKMKEALRMNTQVGDKVSQMFYRAEIIQNKAINLIESFNNLINKQETTIRNLKNELEAQNEASNIKEGKLLAEIRILKDERNKIGDIVSLEVMKVRRDYDNLIERLKEQYNKELDQLNDREEKVYRGNMEEYVDKLERVVIAIRERLKTYYDIQRPLQVSWKEEDANTEIEEIMYTEFVLYCANKYESDNKYLAGRLSILEKGQLKDIPVPSPLIVDKVFLINNLATE